MKQLASTVGECVLAIDLECSLEGPDTITRNESNIKDLIRYNATSLLSHCFLSPDLVVNSKILVSAVKGLVTAIHYQRSSSQGNMLKSSDS